MSSVILSGDTSGAITLAAPAVSGTNTITLPASTGTVMVSGNMPAFSASIGSTQTIASPTVTKLTINTEQFDTASCFDSTTNYRFTPNVAGYYQVNLVSLASDSASNSTAMIALLYKNGSPYQVSTRLRSVSGEYINLNFSFVVYMNGTTDYLEVYGQAAANTGVFYSGSTFSACMVRSA